MTSQSLEEIIIVIKEKIEWECGQGTSTLEINKAENELGIKFPADYIQFLSQLGWCSIEDSEIFGIGSDVPFHLNLIKLTHSERTEAQPKLPFFLIPILNDGMGNLHCIDTQNIESGKYPVVLFNHEDGSNQVMRRLAVSFCRYLQTIVEEL